MKKKILVILGIVICLAAAGFLILAGKGYSPSTGRYLRADNADILILDNSPVVMSVNSDKDDVFADYEIGDKLLVLHDGIMESYPAQTRVYFVIKLADGHISDISESVLKQLYELGWTSVPVRLEEIYSGANEEESDIDFVNGTTFLPDIFDITYVRTHSGFDEEKIKAESLNAYETDEGDIFHKPVFRFETKAALNDFIDSFDERFDSGRSNADDFREILKDYDESFFNDKVLFVVYFDVVANNSNFEFYGTYTDGRMLRFEYVFKKSENGSSASVSTTGISLIGVEKSFVGECTDFDAVLMK